jgi:tRNA-splicing ligase RtcB
MAGSIKKESLIKLNDYLWEIPKSFRGDMRVPARVFSTEEILDEAIKDRSLEQIVNVATLPGIQEYALAMPDIHEGYGFPIGGVAAIGVGDGGIISPGGIGYDINCGVRLLASDLRYEEIRPFLTELANQIFRDVPSGTGRGGRIKLQGVDLDLILKNGAAQAVKMGYGMPDDLENCEEDGQMAGADPACVSSHAKNRGRDQLGTLGSGNHFLEIQKIDEVFDQKTAEVFGLQRDCATVLIHCGSRGLGHQVCTDYVRLMLPRLGKWGINLPDRELACAPLKSEEGQAYFAAMAAAANFAWANRHVIAHLIRGAWERILRDKFPADRLCLKTIYDVAHNIGKIEKHTIRNTEKEIIMHRKGATRAFGPGREETPPRYKKTGQPVLIPGTMGTASFVLCGTSEGMELSFGTACHGAGRRMSRSQAKRTVRGSDLRNELEQRGILIRCESNAGLAEEAPLAYKDVESVVKVVHNAGLAKKVARLKPLAVIKGG